MENNMYDLVNEYISQEELVFEGDRGVESLNDLTDALGYKSSGFRYGTSLESFLSDNPGAQEALLDWIRDQSVPEWENSIESLLMIDEDDDGFDPPQFHPHSL